MQSRHRASRRHVRHPTQVDTPSASGRLLPTLSKRGPDVKTQRKQRKRAFLKRRTISLTGARITHCDSIFLSVLNGWFSKMEEKRGQCRARLSLRRDLMNNKPQVSGRKQS